MEAARRILKPSKHISNSVLLGDLGWLSLATRRHLLIINFLQKIAECKENSLLRRVFRSSFSLYHLSAGRVISWAGKAVQLQRYELDHLIDHNGCFTQEKFASNAKQAVIRVADSIWSDNVVEQNKLSWYSAVKDKPCYEHYLDLVRSVSIRRDILALRAECFGIRVEIGRYAHEDRADRKCPLCNSQNRIEDVKHFLLECPLLSDIRADHIELFDILRSCHANSRTSYPSSAESFCLNALLGVEKEHKLIAQYILDENNRRASHDFSGNAHSITEWNTFGSFFVPRWTSFLKSICSFRRALRGVDGTYCPYYNSAVLNHRSQ